MELTDREHHKCPSTAAEQLLAAECKRAIIELHTFSFSATPGMCKGVFSHTHAGQLTMQPILLMAAWCTCPSMLSHMLVIYMLTDREDCCSPGSASCHCWAGTCPLPQSHQLCASWPVRCWLASLVRAPDQARDSVTYILSECVSTSVQFKGVAKPIRVLQQMHNKSSCPRDSLVGPGVCTSFSQGSLHQRAG